MTGAARVHVVTVMAAVPVPAEVERAASDAVTLREKVPAVLPAFSVIVTEVLAPDATPLTLEAENVPLKPVA